MASGETAENFYRFVGRAVVRYDQAPVRVRLIGDRSELRIEKRRAIFRAHQYGDLRGVYASLRHPSGDFAIGRHGFFKPW